MSDLNEDGLMPNQQVDFETLQRVKRQPAKVKEVREDEKPTNKTRRTKASDNNDK